MPIQQIGRKPLSARQKAIWRFIAEYVDAVGYSPTLREIAEACEVSSTSVVAYNLMILHREGIIRKDPEVSRGIRLLKEPA